MQTQGIRYCGAKTKIIPRILDMIPTGVDSILDGCAGSTRCGQAFKQKGYSVVSNDLSDYSRVFGNCYLVNDKPEGYYQRIIDELNNEVSLDGFLTENYGGEDNLGSSIQGRDGKKKNWQIKNTRKADAIRARIEKDFAGVGKDVLVTSLILALDSCDNNLGHQVAFLSKWSKRSYADLHLTVPHLLFANKGCDYKVIQQDIKLVKDKVDLTYLDFPYGTNRVENITSRVRYSSYYNIWNTICKWDNPVVFGKSARRLDSSDKHPGALSDFESVSYDHVFSSIKETMSNLNCKYILFSYNNKSKVDIPSLTNYFATSHKLLKTESFPFAENVQKRLVINGKYPGDDKQNMEYLFLIEKV